MAIMRKLLGLKGPEPAKSNATPAHDQLSVDVAIASQKNDQAAQRVRETLAQLLKEKDGLAKR